MATSLSGVAVEINRPLFHIDLVSAVHFLAKAEERESGLIEPGIALTPLVTIEG